MNLFIFIAGYKTRDHCDVIYTLSIAFLRFLEEHGLESGSNNSLVLTKVCKMLKVDKPNETVNFERKITDI